MTETLALTRDQIMYLLSYALAAHNLDGYKIEDSDWDKIMEALGKFNRTIH